MEEALNVALRLLSYRLRSEEEIRRRLCRRFPRDEVEEAITRLKDQGLLNDATFASYWRQGREFSRPRSEYMVRYELLKKGVPREVAAAALEGFDDEENAYKAACKILPRISRLDYPDFSRKLAAYLARRGFGWSVIRNTTQRTWSELTNSVDGAVEGKA